MSRSRAMRWLWASVGLLFVGIGAVGAIVPGLPTTVFLMGACWAFAKSCPALERWVLSTRLFRPYAKFVDGSTRMPVRAKVTAITLMWLSVALSVWLLATSDSVPLWVSGTVVAAASVGTVVIVRWQPKAFR